MRSLASRGLDKLTFILSPKIKFLGGWLEQLIAESTGKDGKGILPVDLEPEVATNDYARDRVFVYIKVNGDNLHDKKMNEIKFCRTSQLLKLSLRIFISSERNSSNGNLRLPLQGT